MKLFKSKTKKKYSFATKNKKYKNYKKFKKKDSLKDKYTTFCYKAIGRYFDDESKYKNLSGNLRMANMTWTPGIFISTTVISGILVTIASLFLYYLLFVQIIQSNSAVLFIIVLTLVNSIAGFMVFPFVLKSKISSRKMQIEHELPFTLSELSVLASTGLTPIKIIRHMVEHSGKNAMGNEFRKMGHKIDIEGKDIVTAISETAKETPSTLFRETLWDLSNMIHQGGDLDVYLRNKADHTMQLKREIQKEFIEKLGNYSEMYISLVLVGVLFIGIAAFLMDVMGASFGGINAETLLMMLAYGILPVAVLMINLIIATSYARS